MYLLHGSPGWPRLFVDVGALGVRMDTLVHQRRIVPFIVVMPDGRDGSLTGDTEWADTADGNYEGFVTDVVREVDRRLPTIADREHRVLAGDSAGAYAAANIALHQLDTFPRSRPGRGTTPRRRPGSSPPPLLPSSAPTVLWRRRRASRAPSRGGRLPHTCTAGPPTATSGSSPRSPPRCERPAPGCVPGCSRGITTGDCGAPRDPGDAPLGVGAARSSTVSRDLLVGAMLALGASLALNGSYLVSIWGPDRLRQSRSPGRSPRCEDCSPRPSGWPARSPGCSAGRSTCSRSPERRSRSSRPSPPAGARSRCRWRRSSPGQRSRGPSASPSC